MVKQLATLLCVFAVVVFPAAAQTSQDLPSYRVCKTNLPIKIDGKVDDEAWKQTTLLGPFLNNRDSSPSPLETKAWILWDDTYLYFASQFADENVWATMTKRDEHLWTEEVVEMFIWPDPKQTDYIELEVNPLGTLIDIYLLDIRKPLPYESWNSSKIQWAVNVEGTVDGKPGDKGWSCEIAMPMEDIVPAPNIPPKPGDRWRINVYRVERLPERVSLAWSPTVRDFHRPDKFGEIIFADSCAP